MSDLIERLRGLQYMWNNGQPVNDIIEPLINDLIIALTPVMEEEVRDMMLEIQNQGSAVLDDCADLIERLAREKAGHKANLQLLSETCREHVQRIEELEETVRDLDYMEKGVSTKYGKAAVEIKLLRQRAERAEQQRDELLMFLDGWPTLENKAAAARIRAMGADNE